jgi:hypothetical protein
VKHPLDWFIKDSEACWKCRELKVEEKEVKRDDSIG